jgi:hypothetical protein
MRRAARIGLFIAVSVSVGAARAGAQNRGVYPLGMSANNSGVTPASGLTYANQLLFYSRDRAKDDEGNTIATGDNDVLMDMNTFAWVSAWKVLGGAHYSAAATLPFAKNSLTSDAGGRISGGGGFADSYYMPLILGWNGERVAVRAIYGFLAPTGRFVAGASDNVGSGYWTHALSSGQTFYLRRDKRLILSTFEMYEFHTTQEDTGVHPGQTFDLDYSLMVALPEPRSVPLQVGLVGYGARQTTAKSAPTIPEADIRSRYAVNAIGGAVLASFPRQKAGLGARYFQEFANRSTYEGFSAQIFGSIRF